MLQLSYNNLRGTIPSSLGNLTKLIKAYLSNNNFHGQIPPHLSNCQSLIALDLSNNNLSGVIPPQLIGLSSLAIVLDLSHNHLTGVLPTEVGNLKALTELDISDNLLAGSFGSVYRGILEDNGMVVAVKVLHLVRCGALKSFIVECEALKNIKHRNLLKILTVCSGSDYQGNDFKALVYEFMDNGSLEQWLHSYATSSHGNMLSKKLNIIWRINIAIDVASALDYLHHQCHIPIVHCDLKPSNILLDVEMVAHVGDFGLAKFLLESSLDTVDNQMSSGGLRGTMGYAPPEYAMGCKVSREGDVYSFGILLLEIFTGLSPTDVKFRDNLTLHSFVEEALPKRVLEITDSFMLQERESHLGPYSCRHWSSERDNIFQECLVMVYNIGVACSYQVPGRRMNINEVANQLHQIRKKLFALGLREQDEPPIA
ncbi:putative receptor-like protein kinase At3g47110 [Eucalyptus grandis]|uniref:putative receptor-like protein kinase At3g47110 n=1 Tax=Eucalyptus grandis TaxID=71139 RepID=UPI00192ED3BD|nr:putative receptor-like protein kinase At3g47110 [Eucalyptus grandis]